MKNLTYILRLSLTLLLITAIMAAALAGVNAITEEKIAAITKEKTDAAIREVLPGATYISEWRPTRSMPFPEGVSRLYDGASRLGSCTLETFGERVGFAVEVVTSGFDGEITMMVGVDKDGKVLGISIISHTETAGLGAVAAASSAKGQAFRSQFVGLGGELAVTKDGGEVDAITGATITSRAVTEGVNTALEFIGELYARFS